MWVKGAAIRPVPRFAVIERATLDAVERELADDSSRARDDLDGAFARFEMSQPTLTDAVSQTLSRPLDETALALGYFLSIAIWLAFERSFGENRLREVSADALKATADALTLEEELRAANGAEPLDIDDVIAREQPSVLAFVHEHVNAALDPTVRAAAEGSPGDVDVDDVHAVYRATILLTLCLSHAVIPLDGTARIRDELMA